MTYQNQEQLKTEQYHGPHIPKIQWEQVYGPISNTVVTTFIFLIFVIIFSFFSKKALTKERSRLKHVLLNIIGYMDRTIQQSFQNKLFARAYFPLVAGIFFIILFGNIFGLLIDWVGVSISESILYFMRPMNSDLNTSLVLALITVVTFLFISLKQNGVFSTLKSYLFHFHGNSLSEKCINVFVGWLHLISVPSTIASLSLRLFGNIFAWVVLIGVITYLWALMSSRLFEVGRLIALPFWFFELFIAFIQAAVFAGLMISYFEQSKNAHH